MNGEGIPDILLKRTLIKCKNRRSWPDKSAYHMPYDTVYVYGAVPTTPVSLETFTGDGPWASGHTMCVRMHAYRRSGRTRRVLAIVGLLYVVANAGRRASIIYGTVFFYI